MARYSDARRQSGDQLKGMEIFEVTPVILGGSPIDPANKTALTRQQHIDACRYWNEKIQELRSQKNSKNPARTRALFNALLAGSPYPASPSQTAASAFSKLKISGTHTLIELK